MTKSENVLVAKVRDKVGKGSARQARRDGQIPAVLYGRGTGSVHLLLPGHETFLIVKDSANALVTVKFDGKEQLALVKSVQIHPVRRHILHVDLLVVSADDKVEVEVPLVVVGSSAAGTQYSQEEFQVTLKAPAIAIPEVVEVDVTGLPAGTMVRVADLQLPENVEAAIDAKRALVSITPSSSARRAAAAAQGDA